MVVYTMTFKETMLAELEVLTVEVKKMNALNKIIEQQIKRIFALDTIIRLQDTK